MTTASDLVSACRAPGMRIGMSPDKPDESTDRVDDSAASHEGEIKDAAARPADSGTDVGPSAQR